MNWPGYLLTFIALLLIAAALTGAINTPTTPDPAGWLNQKGERP